jgi:hypothetical protein
VQETENGPPKVVTGAIVGEANLYDVIFYGNKNSFVKDKDKTFCRLKLRKTKMWFFGQPREKV